MPMLIGDILRRQARISAKKIGVVDEDEQYTYQQLNERANRLANGLQGLGVQKGDRIAFMADNCHQYVDAYFGPAKAGLVLVPVNARFNANEVAYSLNHSESDVFIYQDRFEEIVSKARPGSDPGETFHKDRRGGRRCLAPTQNCSARASPESRTSRWARTTLP